MLYVVRKWMLNLEITALKVVGVIVLIVGFVMAFSPKFFSDSSNSVDAYSSIEASVKWGFLIGFGALLVAHNQLTPWLVTLSALLFWLTAGIVSARLIGIVRFGLVGNQWLWLLIEVLALIAFGLWQYKLIK